MCNTHTTVQDLRQHMHMPLHVYKHTHVHMQALSAWKTVHVLQTTISVPQCLRVEIGVHTREAHFRRPA